MLKEWDHKPKSIPSGRPAKSGPSEPAVCRHWQAVAGDAGWAGIVADQAMLNSKAPVTILYRPGMNILPLVVEAMALLPPEVRWDTTFSTYYTKQPAGVDCQWRFTLAGSPEALAATRVPGALIIDLTHKPGRAPDGLLVEAARTGHVPEHLRYERPAPPGTPGHHSIAAGGVAASGAGAAPVRRPAAKRPVSTDTLDDDLAPELPPMPQMSPMAASRPLSSVSTSSSSQSDAPLMWIGVGIAAAALLLVGAGMLWFVLRPKTSNTTVASSTVRKAASTTSTATNSTPPASSQNPPDASQTSGGDSAVSTTPATTPGAATSPAGATPSTSGAPAPATVASSTSSTTVGGTPSGASGGTTNGSGTSAAAPPTANAPINPTATPPAVQPLPTAPSGPTIQRVEIYPSEAQRSIIFPQLPADFTPQSLMLVNPVGTEIQYLFRIDGPPPATAPVTTPDAPLPQDVTLWPALVGPLSQEFGHFRFDPQSRDLKFTRDGDWTKNPTLRKLRNCVLQITPKEPGRTPIEIVLRGPEAAKPIALKDAQDKPFLKTAEIGIVKDYMPQSLLHADRIQFTSPNCELREKDLLVIGKGETDEGKLYFRVTVLEPRSKSGVDKKWVFVAEYLGVKLSGATLEHWQVRREQKQKPPEYLPVTQSYLEEWEANIGTSADSVDGFIKSKSPPPSFQRMKELTELRDKLIKNKQLVKSLQASLKLARETEIGYAISYDYTGGVTQQLTVPIIEAHVDAFVAPAPK